MMQSTTSRLLRLVGRAVACPLLLAAGLVAARAAAEETLTMTASQCAGLSGFRAHWDRPIAVAEDGQRLLKDSVIKDRGQTAVWGSERAGPLAFDAVHRRLLVRFFEAAEKIAAALAAGQTVEKVELVLPYLAWVDWVHGQPPRFWEGHLTGADNIVRWYNYRDAMPAPMQDSIIRCWTAWPAGASSARP
ncbi:MAG: hypothetical protein NTY19_20845 [Planctomycetota bacterium]|nr:hypothetical protein [Planctomycetota bacterium]